MSFILSVVLSGKTCQECLGQGLEVYGSSKLYEIIVPYWDPWGCARNSSSPTRWRGTRTPHSWLTSSPSMTHLCKTILAPRQGPSVTTFFLGLFLPCRSSTRFLSFKLWSVINSPSSQVPLFSVDTFSSHGQIHGVLWLWDGRHALGWCLLWAVYRPCSKDIGELLCLGHRRERIWS